MKLTRLNLHGFKSFADRTELRFHDGVTAIVGPNGCGKSNISDAIRWVMGEQRASAIRGSKMEEAIFQGTAERRAVGRAEVSLVLSNDDHRLAIPQSEVEIRRTVFREGGSDYELNRQGCRLRDIQDLLRDTGLGANSYAVIEQGMVDAILSERAEDRRHMFEEAAGIGRYKDRRKAAQRRLEGAEADLSRLEDLIGEVDSQVRSLGRQRKRALRYKELRARRLAVEVALAAAELERVREELAEAKVRLEAIARDEPSLRADLATREAELERRRLESAEAMQARNAAAAKLEETNRLIAERERELAVADERRAHAVQRRRQIEAERTSLAERRKELELEIAGLVTERDEQRERVAALAAQAAEVHERQQALRQELAALRSQDEQARARDKELAQRLSRLEAEAAGAEARAAEAEARIGRLGEEQTAVLAQLGELDQQGDLFAERSRELASRIARLSQAATEAAEALQALRTDEAEARRRLAEAEEQSESLAAKVAALDALERDYHGFAPAVAAALGNREELHGLLGPLADFLHLPKERAAALEGALGSLLQVLVVSDDSARAELRRWLEAHPDTEDGRRRGDGVVAMLSHDELRRVEALVEALDFAGQAPGEPAILGRRERLARLREEADAAVDVRSAAAAERAAITERVAAAEAALEESRRVLSAEELELRRIDSDEAARAAQRQRIEAARQELEERRVELSDAGEASLAHARASREQHAALETELLSHREAWQRAAEDVARRDAEWEAVRDEEAELRVAHARAESQPEELERRHSGAVRAHEQAGERLAQLGREEKEHEGSLTQLEGVRGEAGSQLETLFRERDEVAERLRALEERLEGAAEGAERLESEARLLRRALEERGEERHRLELRLAEAQSRERGVRERLEAEWARPFQQLIAQVESMSEEEAALPEGGIDVLRAELAAVAADIERLGPINMLAVEEYEEESKRLEFLTEQREDLVKARDDLQSAIRQINRTAKQLFQETFDQVRANFERTFTTLFEGGTCDLRLADEEDPLESPIDISASPRGKRTQRIHLLSGGERALTALALMFAIYLYKPSPFCVLDEVDAPLDEANIGRFLTMLDQFKESTQFIVITHNQRTMSAADWIYGVTMEEPGVSSIVGVKLEGDEGVRGAA